MQTTVRVQPCAEGSARDPQRRKPSVAGGPVFWENLDLTSGRFRTMHTATADTTGGGSKELNRRQEAEWLARLQAGDTDAWNGFFDRYRAQVWRVICLRGRFRPGQEDQAEDILQETFQAAIKSIRTFRGESKLGTWVCRLALNKTVDHIRKLSRHPLVSLDDVDPDPGGHVKSETPDDSPTPAEEAMRGEDRARLWECLNALESQTQRWWLIVFLRYFADLGYEEVACRLGIPLGTVKASLRRAHLRLADCLEGNKNGLGND